MLIKLLDAFVPERDLWNPHKGIVVDNQDPRRLGRVKCLINGLLPSEADLPEGDEEQVEDQPLITDPKWQLLPWIMPLAPAMLGGSVNSSWFGVPEVGSELIIVFPWTDIYFGFYIGYWQSDVTHQGVHNEDYPDSYGFEDTTGFRWRINKAAKTLELIHPSGLEVNVDSEGNVDVQTVGTFTIRDPQGQTGIVIDPATGSVTTKSPNTHRIENDLELDNNKATFNSGTWKETLTGSKQVKMAGGYKRQTGGSESVVVGTNTNRAAAGNESKVIGGKASHTYGLGKSIKIVLGDYEVQTMLGAIDLKNTLGGLKIPISGIVELNGILLRLQGGTQQALLGMDTVQWMMTHNHPTAVGPSGPALQAPQALKLLSPKTWLS